MADTRWRIRIRPHLTDEQKRVSSWAVSEEIGMAYNTVRKYMDNDEVITDKLSTNVYILADYFGLNRFQVVQVVTEDGDVVGDDAEGEMKAALSA